MGVAVRRLHFEDAIADIENGDIERAAAEVEHGDLLVFLLVQTIRERGGRRFIDDALHIKTGDAARVLCRLALLVVEVRRNRDDGFGDLLAEVRFRILFQFAQHHRGNLLRGVDLARHFDRGIAVRRGHDLVRDHLDLVRHLVETAADETLDGINRGMGVRHGLTLSGLADEHLARLRERNDRRSRPRAFLVRNDYRVAAFHNSHAAVRCAQVNTKYFCHNFLSFRRSLRERHRIASKYRANAKCRALAHQSVTLSRKENRFVPFWRTVRTGCVRVGHVRPSPPGRRSVRRCAGFPATAAGKSPWSAAGRSP